MIGVEHAEPVVGLQTTIRYQGESYGTVLEGYERNTRVHGFGRPLPSDGVLVGHALEDILGVDIGDQVTIVLASLDTEFTTTLAGFVDEPLGTMLYMDVKSLETKLGAATPSMSAEQLASPTITTIKAQFEEGDGSDIVTGRIKEVADVAAVIDATLLRELVEEFQVFLLCIRSASYVAAAVAMFVVAGLSLIPAVRAVKRINVGEIVRERAV